MLCIGHCSLAVDKLIEELPSLPISLRVRPRDFERMRQVREFPLENWV
jgi:flagellar biosynthesis/type III secretory pathway protein FliH